MPLLEEVFRRQGTPTHTFVEPAQYGEIRLSIRDPGRSLVIEGPSGIGKSTVVDRALNNLGTAGRTLYLSARKPDDLALIEDVLGPGKIGPVIIDDFHKLSDAIKHKIADRMKTIADSDQRQDKLVLIGINKSGDRLIYFAPDVATRIDIFRLEANEDNRVRQLIELGEKALNIEIACKEDIVQRAQGSFQIAQVLCYTLCAKADIDSTVEGITKRLETTLDVVVEKVMADLSRQFGPACLAFARGSKLRPEGRAPYLHILKWLADTTDWSLDISEELRQQPTHRGSIGQVIDKGFLEKLLSDPEKKDILEPHFHYDPISTVLSVEDPKLIFYLKNLVWRAFTKQVGFTADFFERPFDFALSFAGNQREVAAKLYKLLTEREISVFYDKNEEYRIIARDVEEYLAPIYRSEALFVVPLLSPEYPTRIWAKIESDAFKGRFGEGSVIPIRLSSVQEGFFNDYMRYGYLPLDLAADVDHQLNDIAETLSKRLKEERTATAKT